MVKALGGSLNGITRYEEVIEGIEGDGKEYVLKAASLLRRNSEQTGSWLPSTQTKVWIFNSSRNACSGVRVEKKLEFPGKLLGDGPSRLRRLSSIRFGQSVTWMKGIRLRSWG